MEAPKPLPSGVTADASGVLASTVVGASPHVGEMRSPGRGSRCEARNDIHRGGFCFTHSTASTSAVPNLDSPPPKR